MSKPFNHIENIGVTTSVLRLMQCSIFTTACAIAAFLAFPTRADANDFIWTGRIAALNPEWTTSGNWTPFYSADDFFPGAPHLDYGYNTSDTATFQGGTPSLVIVPPQMVTIQDLSVNSNLTMVSGDGYFGGDARPSALTVTSQTTIGSGGSLFLAFGTVQTGSLSVSSSGAIGIEISGSVATQQPRLAVTDVADASGSFGASVADNTILHSGDSFTVLTAQKLNGSLNGSSRSAANVYPSTAGISSPALHTSAANFTVTYNNSVNSGKGAIVSLVYQPALLLAELSSNIYTPKTGPDTYTNSINDYYFLRKDIQDNNPGYFACAYANTSGSQIVLVVRGSETWKNLFGDTAFVKSASDTYSPTPLLRTEVQDAANFLATLESDYPKANIILTGHSLGGAVVQMLGMAARLDAYAFNAPGSLQLYDDLSTELRVGKWGDTGVPNPISDNYRMYADQASLIGKPIGTQITLPNPTTPATLDPFNIGYYLHAHSIDTIVCQLMADPNPVGLLGNPGTGDEPNHVTLLTNLVNFSGGRFVADIVEDLVQKGVFKKDFDPSGGPDFTLIEDPGSPNITSITLPIIGDITGYDVRYLQNGIWSTMTLIAPDVVFTFPDGVTGVDFIGVDTLGQQIDLSDFAFELNFNSAGIASGTFTETAIPEPSAILTLLSPGLLLLRRQSFFTTPPLESEGETTLNLA